MYEARKGNSIQLRCGRLGIRTAHGMGLMYEVFLLMESFPFPFVICVFFLFGTKKGDDSYGSMAEGRVISHFLHRNSICNPLGLEHCGDRQTHLHTHM